MMTAYYMIDRPLSWRQFRHQHSTVITTYLRLSLASSIGYFMAQKVV